MNAFCKIASLAFLAAIILPLAVSAGAEELLSCKTERDFSLMRAAKMIEEGERGGALRTLADAASNCPDDAGIRKAYGSLALKIGNLPVAVRELTINSDRAPDDSETLALLASALWRLDEGEEALNKLKRACELDNGYCPLFFLTDIAYSYHSGDLDAAAEKLDKGKEFACGGCDYERSFYRFKAAVYEKLALDPPFYAFIRTGAGYDSNAVYDPGIPELSLAEKISAPFVALAGAFGATPLISSRNALGGDLSASRRWYLTETADDFSSLSFRATARYRYLYSFFGVRQNLLVRYVFSAVLLDGGPLLEEDERYLFSESHGGGARLTLNHSESHETYIEGGGAWEGYRDIRRVGMKYDLSIGKGIFFLQNRLKFFPAFLSSISDAYHTAYDLVSLGGFAGVSMLLPHRFETLAKLQYLYGSYYHSTGYEPWGEERRESLVTAEIAFSRRFGDYLKPEISLSYIRNISTVSFFDYSKVVAALSLNGEF
ncbi:MAG: hypothetical protein Kow0090_02390 [Myxococcota bacterium]